MLGVVMNPLSILQDFPDAALECKINPKSVVLFYYWEQSSWWSVQQLVIHLKSILLDEQQVISMNI